MLDAAAANGFTPDIVNIMTMDYGPPGTEMGTAANHALDATAGQAASVFGISASAAYARLGNTPMIGQNDTSGEIFTLDDATNVESHAAQQGIAVLSFWAEGRDNGDAPERPRQSHLQRDQPEPGRLHPGVPALHQAAVAAVRRPRLRPHADWRFVRRGLGGRKAPRTGRAKSHRAGLGRLGCRFGGAFLQQARQEHDDDGVPTPMNVKSTRRPSSVRLAG